MTESSPDGSHLFLLVKTIIDSYCKIRLNHFAKHTSLQINEANVRKNLTKLILFKHQ